MAPLLVLHVRKKHVDPQTNCKPPNGIGPNTHFHVRPLSKSKVHASSENHAQVPFLLKCSQFTISVGVNRAVFGRPGHLRLNIVSGMRPGNASAKSCWPNNVSHLRPGQPTLLAPDLGFWRTEPVGCFLFDSFFHCSHVNVCLHTHFIHKH